MKYTKSHLSKIIIVVAILTIFISCKKEITETYLNFEQSELIVDVDEDVNSFRIVTLKEIRVFEYDIDDYRRIMYCSGCSEPPTIYLVSDTTKTTAKENVHFINTAYNSDIDDFTKLDETKSYIDIEIIPENITEEVAICYISRSSPETNYTDSGIIVTRENKLKVILRPKSK